MTANGNIRNRDYEEVFFFFHLACGECDSLLGAQHPLSLISLDTYLLFVNDGKGRSYPSSDWLAIWDKLEKAINKKKRKKKNL